MATTAEVGVSYTTAILFGGVLLGEAGAGTAIIENAPGVVRAACVAASLCLTQEVMVNGVRTVVLRPRRSLVELIERVESIKRKIDIEKAIQKISTLK